LVHPAAQDRVPAAVAALVHTEAMRRWSGRGVAGPCSSPTTFPTWLLQVRYVAPGHRACRGRQPGWNEPVAAALAAAALLPEVDFRFTGDETTGSAFRPAHRPLPTSNSQGWLEYAEFLGQVLAAHVVAVFSTDPHIHEQGGLRDHRPGPAPRAVRPAGPALTIRAAAVFSPNEPRAMAEAIGSALLDEEVLAAGASPSRNTCARSIGRRSHLEKPVGSGRPATSDAVAASLRISEVEGASE